MSEKIKVMLVNLISPPARPVHLMKLLDTRERLKSNLPDAARTKFVLIFSQQILLK